MPRVDIPAFATGQFEYVHNVRVPGMVHGRVVRPPTVGAKLMGVDENSVRDVPGLVKVVVKNDFVGVVCEKPWQAIQAATRLKATWTAGVTLPAHTTFFDYLRNQRPTRDTLAVDSLDVDQKLGQAAEVVKATYHYPYQMHGSIGSSCAVADVQGERATIWSPTQSAHPLKSGVAMLLGFPASNVRVIFRMGSGCYGINGADTVSYDAALLSQAVGRPVRVQLSRQDEMAWENYGFAYVIDQRVGLDRQGDIVAWDYEGWSPTLGGRPGTSTPGNVITGLPGRFPAGRVHTENTRASPDRRTEQQRECGAVLSVGVHWRQVRRHWKDRERTSPFSHGAVVVLDRTAAVALTASEYLCTRVLHG